MKTTPGKRKCLAVPVEKAQLSRAHCIHEARRILREKAIEGMSEQELASEIYFHALLYFICRKLHRFHIHLDRIEAHANPIDLSDYGDTPFRKFCFKIVWPLSRFSKPGKQ